jgi:hypothetical protein
MGGSIAESASAVSPEETMRLNERHRFGDSRPWAAVAARRGRYDMRVRSWSPRRGTPIPGVGIGRGARLLLRRRLEARQEEQFAGMYCGVDYSRGGGSSGAIVRETRAGKSATRGADEMSGLAAPALASATMIPAAHEANG